MKHVALVLALTSCGGGQHSPAVTNTSTASTAIASDPEPVVAPEPPPVAAPPSQAAAVRPPVAPGTTIPCQRLIDASRFTSALGEGSPLTVHESTKQDPEATASCGLVRGGKPLTEAEQRKLLKQRGTLGVLPGDEVCRVTAYCWTIEESARFNKSCTARGGSVDATLGVDACVQVLAQGAHDVQAYRLLDDDTRCVLAVRGGPANVENDVIRTCAKAARDLIGPTSIAVP